MNISKDRSTKLMIALWLIAASLVIAACSHWGGSKRIVGHRGRTYYPITDSELNQFVGSIHYKQGSAGDHYRLGRYFQDRGRHLLAVNEFSRTIDLDPLRADAHNAMGVSYDKLQRFELAEQCYRRALILKPDFAAVYNNLGYSYLLQGNPEKSIAPLQKSVDLQGRNIRFHNNLALAYEQTGQIGKASAEFKLSGRDLQAHALEAGTHLPASDQTNDEFYQVGVAPEHKNPPARMAAINISESDLFPDQSRQKAHDTLQHIQNEIEESGVMIANAPAAPLWVAPQIEISNGNGVYKMAGHIGNYFKYKGFDVRRISNADHFEYLRTRIFYSDGQRRLACKLSQLLFGPDIVCDLINSGQKYGQVRILMGEDIAGLNDFFSGRLKIQVANGNGVRAIAQRLSAYLRTKGFYVKHPTNAEHFGYPATQILFPESQLANAQFLAREFPEDCSGRLVINDRDRNTIFIVLGKDFVF